MLDFWYQHHMEVVHIVIVRSNINVKEEILFITSDVQKYNFLTSLAKSINLVRESVVIAEINFGSSSKSTKNSIKLGTY